MNELARRWFGQGRSRTSQENRHEDAASSSSLSGMHADEAKLPSRGQTQAQDDNPRDQEDRIARPTDLPVKFAVTTDRLSKSYGKTWALSQVTINIPRGVVFGILGPNGSGKSTFLRILAGLVGPSAGSVRILGQVPSRGSTDARRMLGVLPDGHALLDRITIWEHLCLIGPLYGLTRQETIERAEHLCHYLNLWATRHTYARDASFGMAKKCALAMALMNKPKILLLDEPFEGVDPDSSRAILDLLKSLPESGTSVILASHLLSSMDGLVSHFAILSSGRLVTTGLTKELSEQGQTLEDVYFASVPIPERRNLSWLRP